jgi:uncharacterized tellurite resistance protein B-like protein
MERSLQDVLGGGLRPNDPRRFLVEAMIGAMASDGIADAREMAMVEKQVAFRGIGASAAKTLVQLSNDAIEFAGSAVARTPAIAKGLPNRIHRLAAFGMATEVAYADRQLAGGEMTFLEALRVALRIGPQEANEILHATTRGELAAFLDDRFMRIRNLIGVVCEVFALRAMSRGVANDDERFKIREFFNALPDLMLGADELDSELFRAFRKQRPPDAQVFTELARIAQTLLDPVDRYWVMVYALVAELPATVPSWRVIPFMGVMQAAFQISDTDMELAVVDALAFPLAMPRPG